MRRWRRATRRRAARAARQGGGLREVQRRYRLISCGEVYVKTSVGPTAWARVSEHPAPRGHHAVNILRYLPVQRGRIHMKQNSLIRAGAALAVTLASLTFAAASDAGGVGTRSIKHVLLLSIDGMHAVDFFNCSHGVAGVNDGSPYCPNMSALSHRAINYVAAVSSKPSDSF